MPTTQQLEIQELARDFARGELRSRSAAWDEARALDGDVLEHVAELGFLGMRVPDVYGGLGFDLSTWAIAIEELAWGDAAVALTVAIHSGPVTDLLVRLGTDEQKERWLPELASGEALGAFAGSEPEAGSDLRSLATRAIREGSGWKLDGTKRWVTNGERAGVVVVLARTADEDEPSLFLVEPGAEGYEVLAQERTLGLRASETVGVKLDGLVVGPDALLGERGRGWSEARVAFDVGRIGVAAQAVGIARSAFEHATAYALERRQFDRPIGALGAIQAKLAEMARRVAGSRALVREAAEVAEASRRGQGSTGRGPDGVTARAAIAKLSSSEAATWVADEAIQVFGGYGFMRDYPVEKLLRDAKGTEIYEGTNEVMRHVIAREILRAAKRRD